MTRWSTTATALIAAILLACGADEQPQPGRAPAAGSGNAPPTSPAPSAGSGAARPFDNPGGAMGGAPAPNADDAGADECGREKFDLQRKPADILLVLDRSGSMQDDVNGDKKTPSKWDLVVPALKDVIAATDSAVNWGLKLFPEGDDAGECSDASYPKSIAVPVQPRNAGPVNQAITNATPKGDGTPTGDAEDEAVKYLKGLADQNPKYILLATDGEPSCTGKTKGSSDARSAAVTAVQHAADATIHTFVVGIATTKDSAKKTLSELGMAGQEAPAAGFYLASTKDELVSALGKIAGAVASCRFPLSSRPPNPDHVGVMLGSATVKKDPDGKDGWNFVDDMQSAIELFGPACDTVKSSGADSVSIVFGCKNDMLF